MSSSVDFPTDLASPDAQAVARLLAAATAPPAPHELRGYEAARRAFERAGTTSVRRGAALPLRKMIGVKVAAVAGVLTVSGVAVAAEADVLPTPIQRVAHQMLGGVGVPDPEPDTTASGPVPSGSSSSSSRPGSPRPTGSPASGTSAGNGVPLPGTPTGTVNQSAPGSSGSSEDTDVATLCRSYAALQAGTGEPLSGHDRRRLATLAGGEDKIPDFCARVLAVASSAPGSQPSPSDGPGSSSLPSPSRDHKPTGTQSSEQPPSSTGGPGGGNGHGHSTSPTHTPHLTKS